LITRKHLIYVFFTLILSTQTSLALKPDEILVIVNKNSYDSINIGVHYVRQRNIPGFNIISLPLPEPDTISISSDDYQKFLAEPIRKKLTSKRLNGKIKCIVTTYGVPIKIGPRKPLKNQQKHLTKLNDLYEQKTLQIKDMIFWAKMLDHENPETIKPEKAKSTNDIIKSLNKHTRASLKRIKAIDDTDVKKKLFDEWLRFYAQAYGCAKIHTMAKQDYFVSKMISEDYLTECSQRMQKPAKLLNKAVRKKWSFEKKLDKGFYDSFEIVAGQAGLLNNLAADIDRIKGKKTHASVDSELSMVLFDDYDLYAWQANELKSKPLTGSAKTIMVSRLDGPTPDIANQLVDKALKAEAVGLKGIAYIDSRGISNDNAPYSFGYFDELLRKTARLIKASEKLPVKQEDTQALFAPGQCPQTALYCGWYSLKKYIDAFDFAEGAIGYHIASWEAVDLRDPNSTQWCPAMLKDGITVTIGAVAEPYLHTFPPPDEFFGKLLNGNCLVEAYYQSKPFNSWQMILIGDPLYTPFKK